MSLFYYVVLVQFLRHPLSSMVFGTNALITKPAISFAPMLTVAIFNKYGYTRHNATAHATASSQDLVHSDLNNAMLLVTAVTPIVIGSIQLIIWSFYTIRNSHTTTAKHTEGQ